MGFRRCWRRDVEHMVLCINTHYLRLIGNMGSRARRGLGPLDDRVWTEGAPFRVQKWALSGTSLSQYLPSRARVRVTTLLLF